MIRSTCTLLCICLALVASEKVSYSGHKVLRVHPENVEQLQILKNLESRYDVWKGAVNLKQPVDIRVSPKQLLSLETSLVKRGFKYEMLIEDVGELIENQLRPKEQNTPDNFLDEYHTLQEIQDYTRQLAADYDFVELIIMPELSYESREILLLKVSTGGTGKPGFWFDGGIHAREWISPATVIYMMTQMITLYGEDQEITALLDAFDWYILPVFNVDGYEYTWTDERLWRKTRSANEGSACIGTDPNRNWDVEWGTVGVSHQPCADTYCGSEAFSEQEVETVVNYLKFISNMQAYLAYHSYGQMYMVPWGFNDTQPPDFDELMEVCDLTNEAIVAVHGTIYVCDQLINLVGPSSGSSADYTYAVLGIKYSYGVELRDTGDFGFLLPPEQIIPTGEETFAGLKVMANEILNRLPVKKQI